MKSHLLRLFTHALITLSLVAASRGGTAQADPPADEEMFRQVAEFQRLKRENPALYQRTVQQRKDLLRRRFSAMGEPERKAFGRFMEGGRPRRVERLQGMRERDPELFRRFAQTRAGRFFNLAEREPERFRQFVASRPRFRERWEEFGRPGGQRVGSRERGPRQGARAGGRRRPGASRRAAER